MEDDFPSGSAIKVLIWELHSSPVNDGITYHINWLAGLFPSTVLFFVEQMISLAWKKMFFPLLPKGARPVWCTPPLLKTELRSAGCNFSAPKKTRKRFLVVASFVLQRKEPWEKTWISCIQETWRPRIQGAPWNLPRCASNFAGKSWKFDRGRFPDASIPRKPLFF